MHIIQLLLGKLFNVIRIKLINKDLQQYWDNQKKSKKLKTISNWKLLFIFAKVRNSINYYIELTELDMENRCICKCKWLTKNCL